MAEQIISKRCSKCKEIKPVSEFYKNRIRKDGLHNYCKVCFGEEQKVRQKTKKFKATQKRYLQSKKGQAKQRRYRQSGKGKVAIKQYNQSEKGKACTKRYAQTEKGKDIHRRKAKKARKENPIKIKARLAVNNAIKTGILPSPDSLQCHHCPAQAKQYHHHKGYAPEHWLDVVPACIKCHTLHTNHNSIM